ncbi:MAG: DNA adenine methylase, partial [Campylobacter sp.]|nr:DNA adenine methylase [Campylobacter sp.]
MIVSPLNYPGNKARILKYLVPIFPQCNNFVDVFCGSGIVGLNSNSKNIILND